MAKRSKGKTESAEVQAKIIILGDPGVGKTSIIRRWAQGVFEVDEKRDTWDSIDEAKKNFTASNGKVVEMVVLDTAGQERFRTLTASFYRGARIVLLVFSLTDTVSFEHIDGWLEDLKRYSGPIGIIMVGNKSDLTDERVVKREEAVEKVESEEGILAYFETSALKDSNINELFAKAGEVISGDGDEEEPDKREDKKKTTRDRVVNRFRR